jgi:RNA polymerase sigma factor (sigma-70 family)
VNANAPAGRRAGGDGFGHGRLVQAAFEAHRQMLFGRVLARTRDPAIAEDVVQDAFTRLLGELGAGRPPDNIAGWLHRVAINLVLSRARHAEVERRSQPALAAGQTADSPEAVVEGRERAREIESALTRLPASDRALILLAAAGASGSELAGRMGRTEPAARTALCRARARLRRSLVTG